MALPVGIETVTVRINAPLYPNGDLRRGQVKFTPETKALSWDGEDLIAGPRVVLFDGADATAKTIELVATDATGVLPQDFTYQVGERWSDAPPRTYSISLPAASPEVDLAGIAPTSPAFGTVPTLGAYGQSLLGAASASAARSVLGLGSAALEPKAAFDLAGSAAAAQAAAISTAATNAAATYGTLVQATAPRLRIPDKPTETVITAFQAGHGWTADGTGIANLNDTSVFFAGSQSASVQTNGAGGIARLSRFAGPTIDATGKYFQIALRVTNLAYLRQITFYAGSSSLANNFNYTLINMTAPITADNSYWVEGEWAVFTIPWSMFLTSGTPDRASITDFRLAWFDDNTDNPVTIHVGKVGLLPDPTSFPNGACCFVFDDGWADAYTQGLKKLSTVGMRATAMPIVDRVGVASYMTLTQLKELQNLYGWEIGAHSYTVANHNAGFDSLTAQQVDDEMRLNKAWLLSNGLTSGVDLFAYPRGYYNGTVLAAAQRYFSAARGTFLRSRDTFPPADRFKIRTRGLGNGTTLAQAKADLDGMKSSKGLMIYTLHKLAGTAVDSSTWSISDFSDLVDYVSAQGVPVRTLGSALMTAA